MRMCQIFRYLFITNNKVSCLKNFTNKAVIRRTLFSAVLLGSAFNHGEEKLKPPDPSLLTSSYLVKNAAIIAADSATSLLSQTVEALVDANKKYEIAVSGLIELLEVNLQVSGNERADDVLWDAILYQRAKASEHKLNKQDLEMVFSCAVRCLEAASEATFSAGAEFSSLQAGELLNAARSKVEKELERSALLTHQLAEVESKNIEKTMELADKARKDSEQLKKNRENSSEIETPVNNNTQKCDDDVGKTKTDNDHLS